MYSALFMCVMAKRMLLNLKKYLCCAISWIEMAEILTLFWILRSMWPDELRKEICKITLLSNMQNLPLFCFLGKFVWGLYS